MWENSMAAIKAGDIRWLQANRREFGFFFKIENQNPSGKLKPIALQHHYKEKLFKIFLGREYQGLGLPLHQGARWIEYASILEPNWGWLLAIGVGGGYFADYLSAPVAKRWFLPAEALIAGSGTPCGKTENSGPGTWKINGRWKYCSGSEQASAFTAVTHRENQIIAFIISPEQVKINRDWNMIGLSLTCSHSIRIEEGIIAEDQFFDLAASPRKSDYPLSSYPFHLFALACFVPVVLGIFEAILEEIGFYIQEKKNTWKRFQPDRRKFIEEQRLKITDSLNILKDDFYSQLTMSWQMHLKEKGNNKTSLLKAGRNLADFCYRTSAKMIPWLGMKVLEKNHPLQENWQHLQTAYQHMIFRTFTG